eukprot:08930_6
MYALFHFERELRFVIIVGGVCTFSLSSQEGRKIRLEARPMHKETIEGTHAESEHLGLLFRLYFHIHFFSDKNDVLLS